MSPPPLHLPTAFHSPKLSTSQDLRSSRPVSRYPFSFALRSRLSYHQVVPFPQQLRALSASLGFERGERSRRSVNCTLGIRCIEFRCSSDQLARRWILRVSTSFVDGLQGIPKTSKVFPDFAFTHSPLTYATSVFSSDGSLSFGTLCDIVEAGR